MKDLTDLKTKYFKVTNEKLMFIRLIKTSNAIIFKTSWNKQYKKSEFKYPKTVLIPPKIKKYIFLLYLINQKFSL